MQALLTEQQRAAQNSMVGHEVGVLFEKAGRLEGQMIGKSDYLHAVYVQAPIEVLGQIRSVRITESAPNSLGGVLID